MLHHSNAVLFCGTLLLFLVCVCFGAVNLRSKRRPIESANPKLTSQSTATMAIETHPHTIVPGSDTPSRPPRPTRRPPAMPRQQKLFSTILSATALLAAAALDLPGVHAERWWLSGTPLPKPGTLEVQHAFSVKTAGGQTKISADAALKQSATANINFVGPITTSSEMRGSGVQLSVLHSSVLEDLRARASGAGAGVAGAEAAASGGKYCVKDKATGRYVLKVGENAEVGSGSGGARVLAAGAKGPATPVVGDKAPDAMAGATGKAESAWGKSTGSGRAWSWALSADKDENNAGKVKSRVSPKNLEAAKTLNGFPVAVSGKVADIKESGVYYVVLSNCDLSSTGGQVSSALVANDINPQGSFLTGEVEFKDESGYLPGEDKPKLWFYWWLFAAYVAVGAGWFLYCRKWKNASSSYILPIHNWISYGFYAGALEAICWFVALYHWNTVGHRWWSMIVLATCSTALKQAVCLGCLLACCLGSGITKPELPRRTVIKIWLLLACFVLFESARNVFLITNSDKIYVGKVSVVTVFAYTLPGSVCLAYTAGWIIEELNSTIQMLIDQKQTVKLEVYQDFRSCLYVTFFLAACLFTYEATVVHTSNYEQTWETKWIFSDALSHCCFLVAICCTAFLWRPSERMAQMAFSVQLTDGMGGAGALGMGSPDDGTGMGGVGAGMGDVKWEGPDAVGANEKRQSGDVEMAGGRLGGEKVGIDVDEIDAELDMDFDDRDGKLGREDMSP